MLTLLPSPFLPAQPILCRKCASQINQENVCVRVDKFSDREEGNLFHPGCFVCCVCQELLVNLIYCFKNDQLYCVRHFSETFRPRCQTCDEVCTVPFEPSSPTLPANLCNARSASIPFRNNNKKRAQLGKDVNPALLICFRIGCLFHGAPWNRHPFVTLAADRKDFTQCCSRRVLKTLTSFRMTFLQHIF